MFYKLLQTTHLRSWALFLQRGKRAHLIVLCYSPTHFCFLFYCSDGSGVQPGASYMR